MFSGSISAGGELCYMITFKQNQKLPLHFFFCFFVKIRNVIGVDKFKKKLKINGSHSQSTLGMEWFDPNSTRKIIIFQFWTQKTIFNVGRCVQKLNGWLVGLIGSIFIIIIIFAQLEFSLVVVVVADKVTRATTHHHHHFI